MKLSSPLNEGQRQPLQVMDTATYSAERRPLLWDAPLAFVLWSLEEAKVRIAERRYEAGETIYSRGDPDRTSTSSPKACSRSTRATGDTRRPSWRCWRRATSSVCLTCGHAALTATRPRPSSGLGSPQ